MAVARYSHNMVTRNVGLLLIAWLGLWLTVPVIGHAQEAENPDSLVAKAQKLRDTHILDAIRYLERAIALAESDQPARDSFLCANYYRIGAYYGEAGFATESFEAFQQSYRLLQARKQLSPNEQKKLADVVDALAVKASNMGLSATSVLYAQQAVALADTFYGEDDINTQRTVSNAAAIMQAYGDLAAAKALAHRALRMAQNHKPTSPNGIALAAVNLSEIYQTEGKVDSAAILATLALPYVGVVDNDVSVAILQRYASSLIAQGLIHDGLAQYESAIHMAATFPQTSPRDLGILYVEYAQVLQARRRPEHALEFLQCALMAFIPEFSERSSRTNPGRKYWNAEPWVFEAIRHKARCFEAMDDPQQALECDTTAFNYLDYLRKSFNTFDDRSGISNIGFLGYEQSIALALQTYKRTGEYKYRDLAFRFMEQSKTNDILESLQEIEQGKAIRLDPALLDRWRLAKMEYTQLSEDPIAHRKALDKLKNELDQLRDALAREYPTLGDLIQGALATPATVQAKLKPGELFLEYFMGDSTIYIFAIDTHKAECYSTPRTPSFDKAMRLLIRSLSLAPGDSVKSWERFGPHAYRLFLRLLGPVIRGGHCQQVPHSLIIVPDGHIALLPFECLLTSPGGGPQPFLHAPYLVRQCALRYGQSATTLVAQGHRSTERKLKDLLALAPSPDSLNPLKYAYDEVDAASESLEDCKVLKDGEANQAMLSELARDYRILHFACHASADTSSHLKSWLALERDGSIDSLFSHEIFELELDAALVVLSACGTGRGQMLKGEGVMSLARSFQAAGCPTAVMSLWNLDDKTTATLMKSFYGHLAKGKPASESLQLARKQYLESDELANNPDRAHPYYWAAMVTVGHDGPHLPQYEVNLRPWLIWGSIAALLIALWQRGRRRKRAAERRR
jgi:hypothetical protein